MSHGERVHMIHGTPTYGTPEDYHCDCLYCGRYIGELRQPDGSYYSRLERRAYYDPSESGPTGHIAKTPLHIARWAIQQYTQPGDWVVDPTIGAGTTAVEALTQRRNAAGMEIQYGAILTANIELAMKIAHAKDASLYRLPKAKIRLGDARSIGEFLAKEGIRPTLIVNNPPYSGDESNPGKTFKGDLQYKNDLPNLAFLKEDATYWAALRQIYSACRDALVPGGHFVVAVKDMMRQKKPFLLHKTICELLEHDVKLTFVGTALLKHHPGTLFLNSYFKRYGIHPPHYQTICVFRKEEE